MRSELNNPQKLCVYSDHHPSKLQTFCTFLLFILPLNLVLAEPMVPSIPRPNFLVIMSDDQGLGDIGYTGNKYAQTPVLDKLASRSAVFTNFVAACACTPSRASFLTGRNYSSTGVWGVGPRGYINRDETFLPEYLRRAGYHTAHFGKWGEGWTPDQRTYMRGYEEAGALGGGYQHKDAYFDMTGKLEQKKGWTVDVIADLTIEYIKRQQKSRAPWYAITAFISPHEPWECDEKYSAPLEQKGYPKALAAFYGMVQQMDAATGRIIQALEETGALENTIVIFASDNGATPHCTRTGGTPVDSPDWAKRNALGLRGKKAMVWQNALRVPFFVYWPGHIAQGDRPQFGAYEDILPTILDLAGVPDSIVPQHLPLHGISLKSVLFDDKTKLEDRYVFRLPVSEKGSPGTYPKLIIEDPKTLDYSKLHASMRGANFVYHSLPGRQQALYDLRADVGETNDVSAQYPELTKLLAKRCRQEWDDLIQSERCFKMPSFLIGDPRYEDMVRCWAHLPPNVVPCNAAQKVSGTVTCPFSGLKGFSEALDSATYSIDVRKSGHYELMLSGEHLDKCGVLEISVNGKTLRAQKTSAKELKFGLIELPLGVQDLVVQATSKGKMAAVLKEIAITPK
jgi:arylsulfatase A-like enzyme